MQKDEKNHKILKYSKITKALKVEKQKQKGIYRKL